MSDLKHEDETAQDSSSDLPETPEALIEYIRTLSFDIATNLRRALIVDLHRLQNSQAVVANDTWSVELRKLHDSFLFWVIYSRVLEEPGDVQSSAAGLPKGLYRLWSTPDPNRMITSRNIVETLEEVDEWSKSIVVVLENRADELYAEATANNAILCDPEEEQARSPAEYDCGEGELEREREDPRPPRGEGSNSGDDSDSASSYDFGSPSHLFSDPEPFSFKSGDFPEGSAVRTLHESIGKGRLWLDSLKFLCGRDFSLRNPCITANLNSSAGRDELLKTLKIHVLIERITRKTLALEDDQATEESHRGFATLQKGERLVHTLLAIVGFWRRMLDSSVNSMRRRIEVRSMGGLRLSECRYCLRLITAEEMQESKDNCFSYCKNDVIWPYPCLLYSCSLELYHDHQAALARWDSDSKPPQVQMFATREELEKHLHKWHFSEVGGDKHCLFNQIAAQYGLQQYSTSLKTEEGLSTSVDGPCVFCGEDMEAPMTEVDGGKVTAEDVWVRSVKHLIDHLEALPSVLFTNSRELFKDGIGAVDYRKGALLELLRPE